LFFEKQFNPYLNAVHSQVEQDVLRRLQKSFDNFFRRVREGARKKGYPRFKSINRYDSITYPQSGFKLNGSRLMLSKISCTIRTFVHRPIVGRIKTCSTKRDKTNAWYVIFMTELENPTTREPKTTIGVDLGITHAAVTSDGQYFDYPKYYTQAEKKNGSLNASMGIKEAPSFRA
jgi:putative transposase